jgi:hypothetical protein
VWQIIFATDWQHCAFLQCKQFKASAQQCCKVLTSLLRQLNQKLPQSGKNKSQIPLFLIFDPVINVITNSCFFFCSSVWRFLMHKLCRFEILHLKGQSRAALTRVFYETSFDSKQPKLEPKLVSILSETRRLFRFFWFNIKTACFGVLVEPKQRKNNRNKEKNNRNKAKLTVAITLFPIILEKNKNLHAF